MNAITLDQIQLFMSLFKGRNDIYARRWEKDGRNGYSPAYQLNWQEFATFKAKGGKFSDFPNKKPLLLTTEVINEDSWKLCYVHGPEGIMVELAERL